MKKTILITTGDPNGIGPEITIKALRHPQVQRACHAIVIGEEQFLKKAGWNEQLGQLLPLSAPHLSFRPQPSKEGGLVSYQAVETGIKLALKTGSPLVTAPISKQSWALAKIPFTGHTELLRKRTQKDGLMMFTSGSLRCALVTEHFPLSHLPLSKERIVNAALYFKNALKNSGISNPFIGICAVNPHASDNGQFGSEENNLILPSLQILKRHGKFTGPLPSDTAWLQHRQGKYDGLLCMYHDQALLGIKLAATKSIVHLTAGLPFVRTSPAHGTAFDIAGKNKADACGMVAAILSAVSY